MTTLKHIKNEIFSIFSGKFINVVLLKMPVCASLKPQFRNFYYIGKDFSPFSGQTQTPRHAKIPVGTRFNLDQKGFSQLL